MLLLYSVLVLFVNSVLPGIIKTPGMQRKVLEETVTFQWYVIGSISKYSVYSHASGTLNNSNAYYTLDSQTGVVTLIIRNIQLSDAGNYSLSVTIGTTVQIDTGALLFVYGYSQSFVNQTSDGIKQLPSTEGDTVELICNVTSTSLPVQYRTKMYYWWRLSEFDTTLQNISSGPAISSYGDLVPGYSIKDDGKTLVIASASYRDSQWIYCYGREQWSPYTSSVNWFYLPLKYRPYFSSRIPSSRKFNAILGNNVSLSVYFQAVPAVTSVKNWSFVDTAGYTQNLPTGSSFSTSYSPYSLKFTFTSEAFYGNYSITFSNIIGSTTETFQVLRPGPPDAPSNVRVDFVSHNLIAIEWSCMWFNGRQQTTYLQLKGPGDDKVLDSWNATLGTTCYNSTYTPTTQFRNGVQPETDYVVSAWSSNDLGCSEIVKLNVTTPSTFKFFVSPRNISFNGNQAIVNFSSTCDDNIAELEVTCCLELTGECNAETYYNVYRNHSQVIFDILPKGNVYIFDFRVYGRKLRGNTYYLTMVKGVRVSKIGESNDVTEANTLLVPVIVLGVLFGVAVLALIGCFIAFLVWKCRQNRQTNNSLETQQPKTNPNARAPQSTTKRTNVAYEEDEGTYTNYATPEVQRYT